MTTKPLTAVERARRKKIRGLIGDGRDTARIYRLQHRIHVASLIDDLAEVAKEYLKGLK